MSFVSPRHQCFPRLRLGEHWGSRGSKPHCFLWGHITSTPGIIVISLCPCVPRQNSVFYTTHCSKIWRKLPLSEPCSRTGDLETFVVWLCASVGCACESLPWDPSRRFIANFISAKSAVSESIFAWIEWNDVSIKVFCNYKLQFNWQTNILQIAHRA